MRAVVADVTRVVTFSFKVLLHCFITLFYVIHWRAERNQRGVQLVNKNVNIST